MGKNLSRHFNEENIQTANKHMKKYAIWVIRGMQIKTIKR